MKTNQLSLGALVLLSSLLTSPGWAKSDEAVLARLEAADARLGTAKALRATFTRTDVYEAKYLDLRQTGEVCLARPGSVRLAITRARRVDASEPWRDTGNNTLSVTNGLEAFYAFSHPYSTQVRKDASKAEGSIDEVPLLSGFFGGKSSFASLVRRGLSDGKVSDLTENGPEIRFSFAGSSYTLTIGAQGLVSSVVIANPAKHTVQTWQLDKVDLEPTIEAKDFQFVTPKDAIRFDEKGDGGTLEVGTLAPDVTLETSDGKKVRLSDLQGKTVVLDFFATWCWPCNQSMPHLNEVAGQSKATETIAVAIRGSRADFDAWVAKHPELTKLRFAFEAPGGRGPSSVFNVTATPTTYVIDPKGAIAAVLTGFRGPNQELAKAIALASTR